VKATALVGGAENAAAPHLDAGHADLVYKEGEFLSFDATAPEGGPGYLYVDGLDQDGNVLHFLPTPQRPDNSAEGGKVVRIGAPDGKPARGLEAYEISPPFGRQMLIAISSKEPLFRGPREQVENAASYFVALGAALAAAKDQGAVASWRFMEVVPKP
jgi:hypothetical protein